MPFTVPLTEQSPSEIKAGLVNAYPSAASGVIAALRDASARSGVNFDLMLASASLESGLNPAAEASTSSATGLFQFIDQTWLDAVRQYGPRHGLSAEAALIVRRDGRFTVDDPNTRQRILDLRKSPDIASAIAGDHLRGISDKLGLVLGQPPDAAETYLGHLLGSGGASQILQAARTTPNTIASDLLPAAAQSNPTLFNAPDGTPYTISQFMRHMRARVGRAYAALGAVMPSGPLNLAQSQTPLNSIRAVTKSHVAPPRKAHQPLERQALAKLLDVFRNLDSTAGRGASAIRPHGASPETLPAGLLSTLRGDPAGKAAS